MLARSLAVVMMVAMAVVAVVVVVIEVVEGHGRPAAPIGSERALRSEKVRGEGPSRRGERGAGICHCGAQGMALWGQLASALRAVSEGAKHI